MPKRLLRAQTDKHSDLTPKGVTVMAVAADLHRDFLIPEQPYSCPTTAWPMICVILLFR
ncbi:MAG: hypothetical protein II377_00340 [Clostridia bacterium]|nr:hypothetical protein [Clostridia bacterium]